MDASVAERAGEAGFAGVVFWPSRGFLLLFIHVWAAGPLSVGFSEGLSLLLLLSWLLTSCRSADGEPLTLRVFTDRRDLVTGLAEGHGEGRWSLPLHTRLLRYIEQLHMRRRLVIQLKWRPRSLRIIELADHHARLARQQAGEVGTTLSPRLMAHMTRASDRFRRRPSAPRGDVSTQPSDRE